MSETVQLRNMLNQGALDELLSYLNAVLVSDAYEVRSTEVVDDHLDVVIWFADMEDCVAMDQACADLYWEPEPEQG